MRNLPSKQETNMENKLLLNAQVRKAIRHQFFVRVLNVVNGRLPSLAQDNDISSTSIRITAPPRSQCGLRYSYSPSLHHFP